MAPYKGFGFLPWHKCKAKMLEVPECAKKIQTTALGSTLMVQNQKHRSILTRASYVDVQLHNRKRYDGSMTSEERKPPVFLPLYERLSLNMVSNDKEKCMLTITSIDEYVFAQVIIRQFLDENRFDETMDIEVTEREAYMLSMHNYVDSRIKLIDYLKFFWRFDLAPRKKGKEWLIKIEEEFEQRVDNLICERVQDLAKWHDFSVKKDSVKLYNRSQQSLHRRKVDLLFVTGQMRAKQLAAEFEDRRLPSWNDRAAPIEMRVQVKVVRNSTGVKTQCEVVNAQGRKVHYEKSISMQTYARDFHERDDGNLEASMRQTQYDRTIECSKEKVKGMEDRMDELEWIIDDLEKRMEEIETLLTIDKEGFSQNLKKKRMVELMHEERTLQDMHNKYRKELNCLLEELPNMKTRLEEDENKFDMCKIKVVDSEAVMTLASMFEEEDFVFEATTETRTRFKSRLSL